MILGYGNTRKLIYWDNPYNDYLLNTSNSTTSTSAGFISDPNQKKSTYRYDMEK